LTLKTDLSISIQEVASKAKDNQSDILLSSEVSTAYVKKAKIKESSRNSLKVLFLQINHMKEDFKHSILLSLTISQFHILVFSLIMLFHMME
jgi:hypothetical protein